MGGKKIEEKHESKEDRPLKEDIKPRKPKVNKFKTFFQKFIPGF